VDTPIRLLLVDDEAQVRRGLAMRISAEPDLQVVGEAPDGGVAVELADSLHPDVVVMDLRMRAMDGITATRQIHSRIPGIRVVVLSLQDDAATRNAATEAGADAFVGKQEGSEALLAKIRQVAAVS
jgi:DNA-binding NarL/FixJ family response regulator